MEKDEGRERFSLTDPHTFVFARIKEPCQSVSSSFASGNLGLGGCFIYHCRANEMRRRTNVACTDEDVATASNMPTSLRVVSRILAGMLEVQYRGIVSMKRTHSVPAKLDYR